MAKKDNIVKHSNTVVKHEEKYNTQKRYCDCIIKDANELRALFSHKNDAMTKLNLARALADVDAIKTALAEVEKFVKNFVEGETK